MRRLTRPLLILLAIVFLIEAWLWSHLEPIVEWIVARIPLRAVKAWLAGTIRKLPPAATLIVFIVPVVMLFPLKLLGLWLLAHKQWIAASVVLVLAKLVGVAVTAFVFEVTRAQAAAARLVPLALRARAGVARLGASTGRPDQAPDQEAAPHLPREADRDARCGCCGASAAACARRAGAQPSALSANAARAARTAQSP